MTLLLPIQLGFIIFILFAASRAWLRFKGGSLHLGSLVFWIIIWLTATIAVLLPDETTKISQFLGIGRGVDIVIYTAIAILFYLVFRLHVYLEEIRSEISRLIRELALKDK